MMKAKKESFLPNSNTIYFRRDANGKREDYFTQILCTRDGQNHNVALGDICAILDNDEGVKEAPWKDKQTVIGQVLALFVRRESVDQSTFLVKVRRLARWKEEASNFGTNKAMKKFQKSCVFRPDQALCETMKVETYSLSDVLRADIQIVDSSQFLTSDKLRADFHPDTDSHTILRCCPARVDDCDKFHDVRADWNNYEDRRSSSKSGRTNKPPSALERGWQLLKDNQLLRALLGTWNIRTDQVFSTKKSATGKEKKRAPEQASLQSSAKRSKKNKSNKNSRSVTFAVGSKPGRTTKRARKNDETTTYYSADSITAQDSITMDETLTEASNEAFMEESLDEISLHAMPFGKPVYRTHARSTSGTTFLEGVEMDIDDKAQACKVGRSRSKQKRWHFRVGDILMIRCKDTSPPQKPFVAGKSMWYPFNVPWSVVQVVAIYRYKDESAMKMQVRWFYRPDELSPNVHENLKNEQKMEFKGRFQSRVLVEVDEHIDEVEVESALGHAKLTSEPSPSKEWFCPDFRAAVPQMGFLCRYMHLVKDDDPILYPVNDWTNYGVSSSPLFRGLHCPKGKPGRSPKLRKRYEERLCHAFGIKQLTESHIGEEKQTEEISVVGWSPEEMDSAQALCQTTHFCYGSKQNSYYSCASVRLVKERCDARGMAKKSEHQEVQVSIGDFVCVTSSLDEAAWQGGTKETKNVWFPFRGPYVVVQVLSIYQQSTKRTSQVLLEVRRFYRRGEIKHVSAECLPENCAKNGEEEVFESFDVEIVPAGRVLGLALVFLGYHNEEYRIKAVNASSHASGLFRPKYRCKFFATQICVQQLFCADSTASKWSRRMLERGLRASKMIGNDTELATVIEFGLGVSLSEAQAGKSNLFQSLIDETKKFPAVRPLFKKTMEAGETSFYSHVCIGIPWSNFVDEHYLCSHRDRNDCWWKVCVGGVVAIRTEGLTPNPYYNCNWEPAQILAIQSFDSAESGGSQEYRFSVRWLRRSGKVALLNSFPGRLRESESHSNCTVSSDDLLGPIYVTSEGSIGSIWDIIVPYLPSNVMIYESENVFDVTLFAAKGLRISGLYSGAELDCLFNVLDSELPGFVNVHSMQAGPCESLSSGSSEPVLIEPTPLGHMYTDASGTDYYCRVKLEPSIKNYAEELREGRHRIDGPWTVEVGDVVGVKYAHGNGKAKYGLHSFLKTSTNWPATYPWAISEISAVLVKKLPSTTERSVELEVRWYYRAPEIKGGTKLTAEAAKNCCEELFESDHYDIIPASAVMFPTKIHEKAITLGKHSLHLGMPVVEFCSYRFWSPRRKSLIPLESSEEARMKRARQYSPLFQHDAGLRDAVAAKFGLVMESSIGINKGWRSSFQDVIQKLSLTDASKEGFKSSKAIVGRDKEMKHILSFLQTALSGSNKEGHRSLFIAGPPGVGKTACVRAAISELEQLRAKGKVPSFDFVCMNGMEMRYPFEAYVQLWEKISGRTVVPEHAAARLEAYFTKEESAATREAKRRDGSVVVLLDEIDYLVTKNQSVLYNFFDWPTHNQQRRLIVLGVSNTLNLAEQLHTRVQSRIGSRRCIFKAYDAKQIGNIIRAKLLQASPAYTVFDEDAILFVSKKTASLSGDIRRAFQICRTAAEHVMRERGNSSSEDPLVTIGDALKVSRESFYSAKSQAMTRCTPFEALLLVTLACLSKSTGREFGGFDMEEILVKMEALANGLGDERYLPTPTLDEAMDVVIRLAEGNIVSVDTPKTTSLTYRASLAGSGGPWPLVSLTVDDLTVLLALKKSSHKELGQKYLGLSGF